MFAAEVESVLCDHPDVAEVAVIGVPHERWGETVVAVVVRRSDVDARSLTDHCRQSLAHYKCPTAIAFAPALPLNANGKVLKRELRNGWANGLVSS